MKYRKQSSRIGALSAMSLLALAGTAMAEDPGLSMTMDRSVISAGESVHVVVAGRFPATGFAMAQADFDVFASYDAWTAASTGALAGSSVVNASFDQMHAPFAGIFADPTNPLPIWQGTYQPNVAGPAFVRLRAEPDSFAYYPSDLTSSSVVEEDALPGRQYLWVDPVHIAGVGEVAPGEDTSMHVRPNGTIVATPEEESVLIGLLLPAVQKVREAAVRMDQTPAFRQATFSVLVEPEAGAAGGPVPTEQFSFNFTKVVNPDTGEPFFELTTESGESHITIICIIHDDGSMTCQPGGYIGNGVSTDGGAQSAPIIRFDRMPTCLTFSIEEDDVTGEGVVVASTCDDENFFVEIPGSHSGYTTGPVQMRMIPAVPIYTDGIKGTVTEARGLPTGPAGALTLNLSTSCIADFDGDGELTILDLLDFMNAFDTGASSADFNGDGEVNILDFLDFLAAFDQGCS